MPVRPRPRFAHNPQTRLLARQVVKLLEVLADVHRFAATLFFVARLGRSFQEGSVRRLPGDTHRYNRLHTPPQPRCIYLPAHPQTPPFLRIN
jgi:hypothetical protein